MDGVLFDSMPQHEKSWKAALKTVDMDYPTEMIYMNECRPGYETIDDVYLSLKGEKPDKSIAKKIYTHKTQLMNNFPKAGIIKGMDQVVNFIAGQNIKRCVVTGSSQASLVNFINKNYSNVFADNIITGMDVKKGKPHPEPYLRALEKMQCKPNEAVVIENAPLGVHSAKSAGIFTVAINTGKLPKEALKDAGADLIVENSEELLRWFKKAF